MDVVIIGAGLSGLIAAVTLHEAGANVQIIEADTHIGGRIHSIRDLANHRVLADLGPTWVWPKYQPVVAKWVEKLGLTTFQQFNDGDAVIVGYGPVPYRQPVPGQDGIARIVGGPTALIDALAERIGVDKIRTSSPVTGVFEDSSDRISVRLESGEIITTEKAIISIPMRVACTTVQMPWAPQALIDVMRRTPTWMSTQAKAVALYERPFWRDDGLSGRVASRVGPLVEVHDHTVADVSSGALFGFVGWSPEQRRNDAEGLEQAILSQLSDCFGKAAAHPIELTVQDWALNSRIVTDLDVTQPADHPEVAPPILRQSQLEGRVCFAVSEASDLSPGLIEGALVSGERAATEMMPKKF
ncbi:Putrescine oxidase [Roseovarius albus]|uniref:Putrescine oxidase n=1 Tax=Roseovarius albus TaxID=1247867 RepID=A0A1X7AB65_9RHOB|nr:NAD(P)/FAD-dependent oxidoreductase [Roseovarius albus]SLN74546.1 Putrescine oxidase [Roseovarius albus]